MGTSQSHSTHTTDSKYSYFIMLHPRFAGCVNLPEYNGNCLAITLSVANRVYFYTWRNKVLALGNQETLMLPQSFTFQKVGYCGYAGNVYVKYECFPFLLSEYIVNRTSLDGQRFKENELWYLVYTLLTAANVFHGMKEKIGDVQPENVFISSDGSIKAGCQYSWPMEETNYYKTFFNKQVTYLAPEEIKELHFGRTKSAVDLYLAETFSVGLTCLDAATLTNSKQLYENNFNYTGLDNKLAKLKYLGYSDALVTIITSMCYANYLNRSKCRDLYTWLTPFEYHINNFTYFNPNIAPIPIKHSQTTSQHYPATYISYFATVANSRSSPPRLLSPIVQSNFTPHIPETIFVDTGRYSNTNNYQSIKTVSQIVPTPNPYTTPTPIYPFQSTLSSSPYNSFQNPLLILPTVSSNIPQPTLLSNYTAFSQIPSDRPLYPNYLSSYSLLYKIDAQLKYSRKMFPS